MKKNWFGLIFWGTFLVLAALNFIACNNDGNKSNPQPVASPNTYNPYNNGYYNQYGGQYGQWYVPNQFQYSQYNCGCMTGYVAATSPMYGQVCVPQATGTWSYMVTYNYNWAGGPAQNTYPLNTPQLNYYSAGANGCYGAMAQGCDVRYNNCPAGNLCQPLGGGSAFGVCIRQ